MATTQQMQARAKAAKKAAKPSKPSMSEGPLGAFFIEARTQLWDKGYAPPKASHEPLMRVWNQMLDSLEEKYGKTHITNCIHMALADAPLDNSWEAGVSDLLGGLIGRRSNPGLDAWMKMNCTN